ncbi:hypothetical protein OEZ85_000161 [Tetradesmus obliquus]|uniref:RING-CH-type domain-containing protein n=1 Tax=Tetradesmus obliquus TaxID=3088 RepID=A0ABY8UR44_TETOB|nr:hypothetical protein OEZ85_000161 [Tetradesmus obliquus]
MPVLHRQRACNRVSPAPIISKHIEDVSGVLAQQDVLRSEQEQPTCRLCWDTADSNEPGGELLSPCACSGSLRYIHKRCLQDWQRTLRSQGQGRRANTCELCKAPYRLQDRFGGSSSGQPSLPRRLLSSLNAALFDAAYASSWPGLAMKLWRSYIMAQGITQALRLGLSGFSAGMSIGKTLIEEQAGLLNGMLRYSSGLLGSPYAEMIWCQAVGALFVGMLSELVYTSILGLLGGLAYGFCTGYVGAIKGSVRLLSGVSCKAATAAACLAVRMLRGALGLLVRVL